jgi:hypothetical protein
MDVIIIDELRVPLPDGRFLTLSDVEIECSVYWDGDEVDWIVVRSFGGDPMKDGETEIAKTHWLFRAIASQVEYQAQQMRCERAASDPNDEHRTYRAIGGRAA